jgi:hypothetical protein
MKASACIICLKISCARVSENPPDALSTCSFSVPPDAEDKQAGMS